MTDNLSSEDFRAALGEHVRQLGALLGVPIDEADKLKRLTISVDGLEMEYVETEGNLIKTHTIRRNGPVIFRPTAPALTLLPDPPHEHRWEPHVLPDRGTVQRCADCPTIKYINPDMEQEARAEAGLKLESWVTQAIADGAAVGIEVIDEGN